MELWRASNEPTLSEDDVLMLVLHLICWHNIRTTVLTTAFYGTECYFRWCRTTTATGVVVKIPGCKARARGFVYPSGIQVSMK